MEQNELLEIKTMTEGMDRTQRAMFYESRKKSYGIAMLLSIIIPGAGLMYMGRWGRGLVVFIFSFLIIPWILGIYWTHEYVKKYNALLWSIIFPPGDTGQIGTKPPDVTPVQSTGSLSDSTKFCVACGAKLGKEIKFCPNCGAKQGN